MTTGEKLRKADWVVLDVPEHAAVVEFFERVHYAKGAPNTSTYRHGLYRTALAPLRGELEGAALWIPPTKNAALSVDSDWQGVLALSRFAIAEECPVNAASFLLGRSMQMIDRRRWPTLLTYADTSQGHTGMIYRATNWEYVGVVTAGDTWVNHAGVQRGRKRGGVTLSASQMRELGFERRAAAPKIKFVHRARHKRP